MSNQTVEEYLCKFQNVWSEDDRYFDRCAAGLGIIDAEHRLQSVMSGELYILRRGWLVLYIVRSGWLVGSLHSQERAVAWWVASDGLISYTLTP